MIERIAAKLNVEKRRAEMIITALVVILVMICSVPATRAMFEAGTNIDVGVSFGEANTSFEYTITGGNLRNPGDTQTVNLKVRSEGNIPMRYFFTIERNTASSRLAAYLGVYLDGEYIGMLSDITTGKLGTFDEGAAIPAFVPVDADIFDNNRYFLIPGDTQEHELKLEYHIGASAIGAAEAKSAEIKIRGYAETIDLKNETVVYTADEFEQAVLLSNYGKLTQNRVILGDNISLTKNLTLDGVNSTAGALNIDINGHTLGLNGGGLTVKDGTSGSGILILYDSCGGGVISGGSGSIVLQGSGAYVAGPGLADYTGTFNVSAYSPSADALNAIYGYAREQAERAVRGGVQSGETNSFLAGYGAYGSALSISAPSYVGYNAATGKVTPTAERNMNAIVNIGGRAIIFEIIGSLGAGGEDNLDAVVDEIESKYLSYLTGGSTGESVVYYDILLPQRLKGYNCHIEWFSSNPEVLDTTGNYTSPWVDTGVTLQAIYTVNDFSTARTYEVNVKGYSYEDKMSFFMAHMGVIRFNLLPEDHILWTKDSYAEVGNCGKDMNIKSITYSIPGQNPGDTDNYTGFLQFVGDGNTLRLYSISNIFEAYINVRIEFEAPPALTGAASAGANVLERQITVIIDLDDYTTAEDILKYVQGYIMNQIPSQNEWTVPVDLYDRMGSSVHGYPTRLRLPAYYEALAYAVNEFGETYEYTAGFHTIDYLIVNDLTGGEGDGDSDKDYDKAKTGTLEIEYTNAADVFSAVSLSSSGEQIITGKSASVSGIAYYDLVIDPTKLKDFEQDLNIIVSLDTELEGKTNALGEWIASTPQDRRNLKFKLPGVLRADTFDADDTAHGQAIYNQVFDNCVVAGLPNAHSSYIFTREVADVTALDMDRLGKISGGLSDDNLWPLKYFTGLEYLDISGSPGSKYAVSDGTINVISKLTGLKTLDISNCSIEDIDRLSGLTDLEYLDVSGNSNVNHVTVATNMAGNLSYLNASDTACNDDLNEWAYAYVYYKYRDAHSGNKPSITKADDTQYEPPYSLWQYPDAYKQYRKLVYANGEYIEIDEASKAAGYVWLPKKMLEAYDSTWANDYFGSGWNEGWARYTSNVTLSYNSGTYEGWQLALANASVGSEAVVYHGIETNIYTEVYHPEDGTTGSQAVDVSSYRCFFFDVVE
jgi:hypothetical protein